MFCRRCCYVFIFHDYYYDHRWRCFLFCITWEVMFLVVINKVDFNQGQCTLVSLIDVLAWINVLGWKFSQNLVLKFPVFWYSSLILTFPCLSNFCVRKNFWKKIIIILPLIRVSWEENWGKLIRTSWTIIRKTRVFMFYLALFWWSF